MRAEFCRQMGDKLCNFLHIHYSRLFSRYTRLSRYLNVSILRVTGAKDDEGGGDNCRPKKYKAPVKASPPSK